MDADKFCARIFGKNKAPSVAQSGFWEHFLLQNNSLNKSVLWDSPCKNLIINYLNYRSKA